MLRGICLALLVAGLAAASDADSTSAADAKPNGPVVFFEPFREGWSKKWVNSTDAKYDGEWLWSKDYSEVAGDYGLKMSSAGKLHAISAPIPGGLEFNGKDIVIQYEVKATNGVSCDGQYLKLVQEVEGGLSKLNNEARYTIMFGPDKCGGTDKVHFILQYQNPVSKEWEEKHAGGVPVTEGTDRQTHIYTLVLRADNTFEILIDLESKKKGSILTDMSPPINPPKEIDDPSDSKPSTWVDEQTIDDPASVKPDDWDDDAPPAIEDKDAVMPAAWEENEPEMVPDPNADKPDDWDDEEDGEWEAPMVPNPKCQAAGCGEWKRPLISNPDYKGKWYPEKIPNPEYKGEWAPRQIPNKNYFEEKNPFGKLAPISAVAIELLSISGGIVFDNILITNSEQQAKEFAKQTWSARSKVEKSKMPSADGGIVAQATKFFENIMKVAATVYSEQPAAFMSGVALASVLIITLVVMCCVGSDVKPHNSSKKNDVTEDDDTDDSDIEDDEEEEDDQGSSVAAAATPSPASARKRASRKD